MCMELILTKYLDTNMVTSNTMGFRVNIDNHMWFCSHGLGFSNLKTISEGQWIDIWPQRAAQRYMWSTMVTLNPMLLEDPILRLYILMRSNLEYIKYMDHIMMSSNHMGIRVIMGDHMCFGRYVV